MKMIRLKKGDCVALAAASRKVSEDDYSDFKKDLEKRGYRVKLSENLNMKCNQFAGDDKARTAALNKLFEDIEVKAIFFIRGGYGAVRIVDELNWNAFFKKPKWLCGYSDVCVLLNHAYSKYGIPTLHCDMPVHFPDMNYDRENFLSALNFLETGNIEYSVPNLKMKNPADVEGDVVGGNLSIIYSLLGSNSIPSIKGKILFLEDLDEYLYHIDRMIFGLKRAGLFDGIKALLVGGMTDMHDNSVPFGKTAEEIILDNLSDKDFPIFFGFPAGHLSKNYPIVIGENAKIRIFDNNIIFSQNKL